MKEKSNISYSIKPNIFKGLIGIASSIGIIALAVVFSRKINALSSYGYIGLFIGCFITNATIFIPTLSISLVIAFSTFLSPLLCGCFAALGCTLGEFLGYWLGRSGRALVEDNKLLATIKKHLDKHGVAIIIIFSALPIPFFDLIGITCGITKFSVLKFFVACLIGKTIKMVLYAYIGNSFIDIVF